MTRKIRTVLFSILVILFLLIAPLMVFYSLGYRIDFKNKKFSQTGAFYFKAWPKSVQIYLDEKLIKKTDFFFGSVFIENLLPKEYKVEIRKEGYLPWKKNLEIKEKVVTEAKNIFLIPEKPSFEILTKNADNLFFSPDEKKIILKTGVLAEESGWALKLFDLERNIKSHLIEEQDISRKKVNFFDLKFSPDSKGVLLEVEIGEKLKFYLLEIDKTPSVLNSLDFLGADVENIFFNPEDSQKLFVIKEGALSEVDLIKKEVSLPLLKNILALSVFNNNIYYLDTSGFLFRTDFSFNQSERINENPFLLKKEAFHQIEVLSSYSFLKEGEALYYFDKNEKIFKKLFEPVNNFKFSPDSKKMVYFNNSEIWILFLEEKYDQPQKKAGDQLFLTRFSEKIREAFWYTSHYLILNVEDKIKIAEIDDRDRINIYDFVEFKNSKIFWKQNDKKLYILSEGNLYGSEKLIP